MIMCHFEIMSRTNCIKRAIIEGAHLGKIGVGEDESYVSGHLGLDGGVEVLWVIDKEVLEDLSHQSVLAHEDLSSTTHLFAGLIHLLGADVVDLHDEHFRVSPEKSL